VGKITATKVGAARKIPGDGLGLRHYDIEWSHEGGHFQHTELQPVYGPKGPPDITYPPVPGEVHPVLKDMVTIDPAGKTEPQIQAELDALLAKKCEELEKTLPKHEGLSIVAPAKTPSKK
jgi:hypothetical protein